MTKMNDELEAAFDLAMRRGIAAYRADDLDEAFSRFETAHVLGQHHVLPHSRTHAWFLRIGWRRRDAREVAGQLLRLVAGAIGSALGLVPLGNTGGANVSPLAVMPIPDELRALLDKDAVATKSLARSASAAA